MNQRQQRLGKTGKIPLGDLRLPAVGVSAVVIDGTEDRIRIVVVHERAGAVVDGFTAKGHIVRVHDAVNEANQQPTNVVPMELQGQALVDGHSDGEKEAFVPYGAVSSTPDPLWQELCEQKNRITQLEKMLRDLQKKHGE